MLAELSATSTKLGNSSRRTVKVLPPKDSKDLRLALGSMTWRNPLLQTLWVCFTCKTPLTRSLSKTIQMSFAIRLSLQGQVLRANSGKYHYSHNITSRIFPGPKRLRIPLLQEEQMWESQTESFHYQHRLQRGVMLSGSSFGYTNESQIKGKCD